MRTGSKFLAAKQKLKVKIMVAGTDTLTAQRMLSRFFGRIGAEPSELSVDLGEYAETLYAFNVHDASALFSYTCPSYVRHFLQTNGCLSAPA